MGAWFGKPISLTYKKTNAFIKGYKRRMCQSSWDHRGHHHFEGRVATLVEEESAIVHGVLYEIDPEHEEETMKKLLHREKAGYIEKYNVPVFDLKTNDLITDNGLLFYTASGAPEFKGEEPMDKTAHIIAYARGPSGKNTEYLFNLQKGLTNMNVHDPYLDVLVDRVHEVIKQGSSYIADEIKPRTKVLQTLDSATVNAVLGINVIYYSKERVIGRVLATSKIAQPAQIVHGGVNVLFAETLASVGGFLHVPDFTKEVIVGQEINCNHIKSVKVANDESVAILGIAEPVHIGKTSHVWSIKIYNENTGELVAISRMTASVLKVKQRSKL
mmetsp:Transcript_13707/g.20765  ORF Transcript_13707/g.20765 Transcript_13707/m.20765 type:complete len:329 (-) Transcript_13707:17-1003(-)